MCRGLINYKIYQMSKKNSFYTKTHNWVKTIV